MNFTQLLMDSQFVNLLFLCDQELCKFVKNKYCPYCRQTLHKADYPRKLWLVGVAHPKLFASKFSLCCGTCRKRTKVPSIRFFEGKSVPAYFFFLTLLFISSLTKKNIARMQTFLKVSKSTIKRWRMFFQHEFKDRVPIKKFTSRIIDKKYWYKSFFFPSKHLKGVVKILCHITVAEELFILKISRLIDAL